VWCIVITCKATSLWLVWCIVITCKATSLWLVWCIVITCKATSLWLVWCIVITCKATSVWLVWCIVITCKATSLWLVWCIVTNICLFLSFIYFISIIILFMLPHHGNGTLVQILVTCQFPINCLSTQLPMLWEHSHYISLYRYRPLCRPLM